MKDFHVHSSYSADSDAPMEAMIVSAVAAGLSDICFTEHIDIAHPDMEFQVDMSGYLSDIQKYRQKFASQIRVHAGIELGVEPGNLEDSLAFYREHKKHIEFWIGSCHVFDGGDPYDRDFFSKMPARRVYDDYFQGVLYVVESFPYANTYGHLDYVMRYDPSPEKYRLEDHRLVLDSILSAIIRNHSALEINTGSYRSGLTHPNPAWEVIQRYIELGGSRVTIGSDAHAPGDVASHFTEIYHKLPHLGLQEIS